MTAARAARISWHARSHPAYWAFLLHRLSGLALALFLPVHLWVLGQALHGEAKLDRFLRWADQPLVKLAETVLIALFAAHLCGGMRLLILEWTAWRPWQKNLLPISLGAALLVALLFALNLLDL
jgi:fumarate reductase subunit D